MPREHQKQFLKVRSLADTVQMKNVETIDEFFGYSGKFKPTQVTHIVSQKKPATEKTSKKKADGLNWKFLATQLLKQR